ncbi:MAG TPA: hypothetical protein VFO68_23245, partial [Actinophytocola sp.]|nr:hypothetical protein [Actinophytocola sp.]
TPVAQTRSPAGALTVATAGELAELSASRRQVMLRVHDRAGSGAGVDYSLLSLCDTCPSDGRVHLTSTCAHGGTRRVVGQWSRDSAAGRLTGVWLTNLTNVRLAQIVDLVELSRRSGQEDMAALRDNFGLQDFEGRSYAGWHHHVTLVSAAHAYRTLRAQRPARPVRPARPARSVRPAGAPVSRFMSVLDASSGRPQESQMEESTL